jgi:hypothetical protein
MCLLGVLWCRCAAKVVEAAGELRDTHGDFEATTLTQARTSHKSSCAHPSNSHKAPLASSPPFAPVSPSPYRIRLFHRCTVSFCSWNLRSGDHSIFNVKLAAMVYSRLYLQKLGLGSFTVK